MLTNGTVEKDDNDRKMKLRDKETRDKARV